MTHQPLGLSLPSWPSMRAGERPRGATRASRPAPPGLLLLVARLAFARPGPSPDPTAPRPGCCFA